MAAIISGGLNYIKISGNQYYVRGNCKLNVASVKNTAIVNEDGSIVYSQTGAAPMAAFDISDYGNLSLVALTNIFGATLIVGLRNGKSYTLTNAVFVDESELNVSDGAYPVKFSCDTINETLASAA